MNKIIISISALIFLLIPVMTFAQGEYDYYAPDETFEDRINRLTKDYGQLNGAVQSLKIKNQQLLEEKIDLEEKLDSALKTVSDLTVENQLLLSENQQYVETQDLDHCSESREEIERLKETISKLKTKLNNIYTLMERE